MVGALPAAPFRAYRALMLTAEAMLLLLTKDKGTPETMHRPYALVGAAIFDLVMSERIALSDEKRPRVTVLNPAPTGSPALDHVLQRIVDKRDGARISSIVMDSKANPQTQLAEGLARQGVLTVEESRAWGLIPEKYPVADPRPEEDLRAHLASVVSGARRQEMQDATVLALLQGVDAAHRVLGERLGDMSKRDLKKRIEQIAADNPAGAAVKRTVDSVNIAIMAAVTAAATSTTT